MKRRFGWRIGLAAGLLVLVSLAGSCGRSAHDPFVGTWRVLPGHGQSAMVITRSGSGYVATIVFWGDVGDRPAHPRPVLPIPVTRRGNVLTGTYRSGSQTLRVQMAYQPSTGHLAWANSRTPNGPLNSREDLVKVSQGTAYPTTQ